jgi:hypothetical protein
LPPLFCFPILAGDQVGGEQWVSSVEALANELPMLLPKLQGDFAIKVVNSAPQ